MRRSPSCFRAGVVGNNGFGRRLSRVCGDLFAAFEDVLSKRVVLHYLLSTVCDDLIFSFEQAWSIVTVFERRLSRVCGDRRYRHVDTQ